MPSVTCLVCESSPSQIRRDDGMNASFNRNERQLLDDHYSRAGSFSRYTSAAVRRNSCAFSSAVNPAAIFLNAFHSTAYEQETRSTGKLLSNTHRRGPNWSMVCR